MRKNLLKFLIIIFSTLFLSYIKISEVWAYSTGMSADLVIGQPDFTSNDANQGGTPSAQTLRQPYGMTIVGNKLIVADANNNRVLIYNSIPTTNNASADVVIGQTNFSNRSANQGGSLNANTLSFPYDVASDETKLFIADWGNDRVLVYNSIPTTNNASADIVIGQVDMTTDASSTTDSSLLGAAGVDYDSSSGKLILTDWGNNRVMIYNSVPTTNGEAADVVIGQTDFTSSSSGTSATKLNFPVFSKVFNGKLFITDEFNARVLIYNSIPTSNGASANTVIGKTTMTAASWEEGGPTAQIFDDTSGVYSDGTRLFIGDGTNSRLLIYNSIPTSNGESTNIVLGQNDFTSNTSNAGGLSASSLNAIMGGIVHNDNYLFISDTSNNRILRYTNPSTPSPTSTPNPDSQSPASTTPITTYNAEWPLDFMYPTVSGQTAVEPIHIVTSSSIFGDVLTIIEKDATVHDIYVKIETENLSSLENKEIPLPEEQNMLRAGDIYNYQSISSFNGYPINEFNKPVTIILPYDPYLVLGKDLSRLRIAYYDEIDGIWKIIPDNTVLFTYNHTIANTTSKFTDFSVVYY